MVRFGGAVKINAPFARLLRLFSWGAFAGWRHESEPERADVVRLRRGECRRETFLGGKGSCSCKRIAGPACGVGVFGGGVVALFRGEERGGGAVSGAGAPGGTVPNEHAKSGRSVVATMGSDKDQGGADSDVRRILSAAVPRSRGFPVGRGPYRLRTKGRQRASDILGRNFLLEPPS